nr:uncharacterized protein CTRU02_09174 [Colletotrichum truncatum]KAF6788853.1 hypothetical protein CTRU02_09174 [Colletotrichum truncatum]
MKFFLSLVSALLVTAASAYVINIPADDTKEDVPVQPSWREPEHVFGDLGAMSGNGEGFCKSSRESKKR